MFKLLGEEDTEPKRSRQASAAEKDCVSKKDQKRAKKERGRERWGVERKGKEL